MKSFFVGNKARPSFLVELDPAKKTISVYAPDQYSKNEEFYEKYALGKVIIQTTYQHVIFCKKPVAYKNVLYVPDLIVHMKNKYVQFSTLIQSLPSI